jgi:hypothetical protein
LRSAAIIDCVFIAKGRDPRIQLLHAGSTVVKVL